MKCVTGMATRYRSVKIKTAAGDGKTARVVSVAIPVNSIGVHILKKPSATVSVAVPRQAAVAHQVPAVLQAQVVRHLVLPAAVAGRAATVVVTGTVLSIPYVRTPIMVGDGKTPKAALALIPVMASPATVAWSANRADFFEAVAVNV